MCGDIGGFQVGASVFVAPVEGGSGREACPRWHIDSLYTPLAGWAADFHDKRELWSSVVCVCLCG